MSLSVRYITIFLVLSTMGCAHYKPPLPDTPASRIRVVVGPYAGGQAAVIKSNCTPGNDIGWGANTEELGELGYSSFSQKYIRESIGMPDAKFPDDFSYVERTIAAGAPLNVGIYSTIFRRSCAVGFTFTPLSGHDYEVVFERPQGSGQCLLTVNEIHLSGDGKAIRTPTSGSKQLPHC